jgi:hypothetical protein
MVDASNLINLVLGKGRLSVENHYAIRVEDVFSVCAGILVGIIFGLSLLFMGELGSVSRRKPLLRPRKQSFKVNYRT